MQAGAAITQGISKLIGGKHVAGADRPKLTDDPTYRLATEKLTKLYDRIAECDQRIAEENGSLAATKGASRLDVEAEKLLADEERTERPDTAPILRRISELSAERRVIERAIEIQKRRVDEERSRVSKAICERLAPEYREKVRGVALALIGLGRELRATEIFLDELREEDIAYLALLRPMPVQALGDPREAHAAFARFLRECVDYSFLSMKEIPAAWLRQWGGPWA